MRKSLQPPTAKADRSGCRVHAPAARRRPRGFTLIEMLIAVVVLGILAAVAYPSLMESIRKSRRSEAFAALAALQQAQERWRSTKPDYTTVLSDLNVNASTASGYYTLSIDQPPNPTTLATGYVITADGSGSSQARDACAKLSVKVIAGDIQYAGCKNCSSFTYSASNPCWSR